MRHNDDMKCVWVGIAAIVIIYLLNRNTALTQKSRMTLDSISGLITRVNPIRAISSRLTRHLVADDMIDACEVFPDLKCGLVSLIDNDAVKKSLPPPQSSDSEKQINLKKLTSFVESKENARACIIIFAHWCPHCKTIIKELVDLANGSGIKHRFLLVNGESVASEAFMGENAMFPLKHYPTILCKVGTVGKEAQSLANANEILDAAANEEASKPATETTETVENTTESTETMLDSLF